MRIAAKQSVFKPHLLLEEKWKLEMDEYVPSFGSEVRVSKRLEHNSSKNVSKRPAFV